MSCNCSGGNVGGTGNSCVRDIVRSIVRAQRQAVEAEGDTCFTGCDRSIEDLLSPAAENRDRLRFNTIPFILYCGGSCKPFVGAGVRRVREGGSNRTHFECTESPIFRVKSFVRNNENCVRLELLVPVSGGPSSREDENTNRGGQSGSQACCGNVCNFFPNRTRDFRATGICITVDLNHFTGISCLDPITPIPARN